MKSNLQEQIDERCPCYAKPLRECNCQFNEAETTLLIPFSCPLCGSVDWQEMPDSTDCSQCHNTVINL